MPWPLSVCAFVSGGFQVVFPPCSPAPGSGRLLAPLHRAEDMVAVEAGGAKTAFADAGTVMRRGSGGPSG